MAGQAIALRIQIVNGSNTLYYLHSDHLGSTRLMSDSNGDPVNGSTTRYYPFGDWRTEPTANLTDRGYTGHQHNNLGPTDLGLIYMNARYYIPATGKFASADTLVPDPLNPQRFNRYTYTLNNPLKFTDPSGHRTCTAQQAATGDETCDQNTPQTQSPPPSLGNNSVPGVVNLTISVEFLHPWGITQDYIHIPIHVNPYNVQLFPWEVAANMLYSEESTLHPKLYEETHPDWASFLEKYWVGDSIGIVQTLVNSGGNLTHIAQSDKYAYAIHDFREENYLSFLAIAYVVKQLDEIPDVINGYAFFSHQDTDQARGHGANLNDVRYTDRAAFGPNPYDLKTWYVFPPLKVDCATTGC